LIERIELIIFQIYTFVITFVCKIPNIIINFSSRRAQVNLPNCSLNKLKKSLKMNRQYSKVQGRFLIHTMVERLLMDRIVDYY